MKLIKNSTWLDLAIDLRNSVILAIWRRVIATMIFALLITIAYHQGYAVNQPILATLIPGVVLGLLLVFRTNTAYDRFWEGCKLWHDLLNAGRILCRNIWTIVPTNNAEDLGKKIAHIRLVGILIITIKLNLRDETLDNSIAALMTQSDYLELTKANNVPLRIINWFAEYFRQLYYDDKVIPYRFFIELNRSLDQIIMLLSGCERILNTPLPRPYSIHLKHLLLLYCFALPFQFVQELDWFTIPVVGIISFALLGIEDIGVEIENPFGYDRNDLPLDRFCQQLQAEIETEWVDLDISTPKNGKTREPNIQLIQSI
ncbi:bestrophin family protein [Planktothrix sp. FACHB-1365]|uniref:bestrophin family protein n=1 Tax=Planktothrix sp. FACHB-1365 TaxID=2692855 RepID=UPI001F54F568|nr:bestrophin family ion channel [Planktothrix sp. FACHB-1365]